MTMKRLLGPALLAPSCCSPAVVTRPRTARATLASEPSSTATSASDDPTEAAPQTIAVIVSQTAAGGEVDLNAVPVDDDAALQEFSAQFKVAGLEEKIGYGRPPGPRSRRGTP